jgi:hypothetical protein
MAYADFTLSGLTKQFDLMTDETSDLYPHVAEAVPDPTFQARLEDDVKLALAISTEKARSEFIIAPILSEVRRMSGHKIALFSGVDFTVDPAQGLAGVCDYILSRSPEQLFIKAPVLMLVEAKNEDMKRGYAQCIGEMLAAQTFNAREGIPDTRIYGVVTTGNMWKFLELEGRLVRIDSRDYYIERIGKIMGILLALATSPPDSMEKPST